jgi:hypothetical protein
MYGASADLAHVRIADLDRRQAAGADYSSRRQKPPALICLAAKANL